MEKINFIALTYENKFEFLEEVDEERGEYSRIWRLDLSADDQETFFRLMDIISWCLPRVPEAEIRRVVALNPVGEWKEADVKAYGETVGLTFYPNPLQGWIVEKNNRQYSLRGEGATQLDALLDLKIVAVPF
jgi:hypothetical protein